MTVNAENMTWREWYRAAGYNSSQMILLRSTKWNALRQAWMRGEDPTEYRAEKEAV